MRTLPFRSSGHTGRADLHGRFLTAAMEFPEAPLTGLPRRMIVFGICSLPGQVLEALDLLSAVTARSSCLSIIPAAITGPISLRTGTSSASNRPGMPGPGTLPEDLDPDAPSPACESSAWRRGENRDGITSGLLYRYDQPETYRERFSQIDLFRDIIAPESQDNGDNVCVDPPDDPEDQGSQYHRHNTAFDARRTLLMQVQQNILDLDGRARFTRR